MLNNLFGLASCAIGLHQGEWQYAQDGSCLQVQVCALCSTISQRVGHTWGNWEYVPLFETRARPCMRCNDLSFDLPAAAELPTLSQVDQAVTACIQTTNLDDLEAALQENQALLFTPVLELYFRYCRAEYTANAEALAGLEQIQAVLQACQESGIPAVIGGLRQETSQPPASPAAGPAGTRSAGWQPGRSLAEHRGDVFWRFQHGDGYLPGVGPGRAIFLVFPFRERVR